MVLKSNDDRIVDTPSIVDRNPDFDAELLSNFDKGESKQSET